MHARAHFASVADLPPAVDWDEEIRAHNRRVVVSLLALGMQLADAEDTAQRAWMRLIKQHEEGKLREVRHAPPAQHVHRRAFSERLPEHATLARLRQHVRLAGSSCRAARARLRRRVDAVHLRVLP